MKLNQNFPLHVRVSVNECWEVVHDCHVDELLGAGDYVQ